MNKMKIKKSDLQEIIKEEAIRLFKIQKLEETKKIVDNNLNLLSEGKKEINDEELQKIMSDLKGIFELKKK